MRHAGGSWCRSTTSASARVRSTTPNGWRTRRWRRRVRPPSHRSSAEAGGGQPHGRTPTGRIPITIGIGQSMGGALTIVQQGWFHCYDGIGVLGYSPLRTHPPAEPGTAPVGLPWLGATRCRPMVCSPTDSRWRSASRTPASTRAPWRGASTTTTSRPTWCRARHGGLSAAGRRHAGLGLGRHPDDGGALVGDAGGRTGRGGGGANAGPGRTGRARRADRPRGETRVHESSPSVDFFVCPRMAHMHNFVPGHASCSGSGSRRGRTGCGTGPLRETARA